MTLSFSPRREPGQGDGQDDSLDTDVLIARINALPGENRLDALAELVGWYGMIGYPAYKHIAMNIHLQQREFAQRDELIYEVFQLIVA